MTIITGDINQHNIHNYDWNQVTEVIGVIHLRGYDRDLYAPLLKKCRMISLDGYDHAVNAPSLEVSAIFGIVGEKYVFYAPSFKFNVNRYYKQKT